MKNKLNKDQNIISEIKRVEKALRTEFKRSLGHELKKTERVLRAEILRAEEKVENSEENLREEIKQTKDDLMNKIDSFAGRTEALEEENTVGASQTREIRVQVDDHEDRITKLESTTTI